MADENTAELTGQQRQIEAVEWAQRVCLEGRVMQPTSTDSAAAMPALHSAKVLPAPQQVRELADALQEAGEVPSAHLDSEDLLTAVQCLGPRQNIDVRERILNGKKLTKLLRRLPLVDGGAGLVEQGSCSGRARAGA